MKTLFLTFATAAMISTALYAPQPVLATGSESTGVPAAIEVTDIEATGQGAGTVQEQEGMSDSGVMLSVSELESQLAKDKASLELSNKFLWVGYASAIVNARKSEPSWGKSRAIAAQKAVIEAENKFAKEYGQKIASEKVRSYYSDDSGVIPDYDFGAASQGDDQYRRILDKLLTLSETKIDNALVELGINPEELKRTPPEQRHLLFKDSFQSSIKREAIANLSGLLTFKTYEGFGDDGEYRVAVVLVLSEKMKQLAYEMSKTKGTLAPEERRIGSTQLQSLIDAPAASLIPDFGVKRMYDAEGYPVLISFGQWALSKNTANSIKLARKREAAYKQAEAIADQGLAEFVNSHINYSSLNSMGEIASTEAVVDPDDFKREEDISQLADSIREKAVKKSRINMVGIRELRRWSAIHPDNNDSEIFGVLRYWSPKNAANMNAIRNWKPSKPNAKQIVPATQSPAAGIKGSQERMTLDDF